MQSPPIPNHPLAIAPGEVKRIAPLLVHALVDLPLTNTAVAEELKALDDELSAGFEPSVDRFFIRSQGSRQGGGRASSAAAS